MPRYHKNHARGYDLEKELAFAEHGGVKYRLGTAGSYIMVCMVCGSEAFRSRPDSEVCLRDPRHGLKVPLTFDNENQAVAIWRAAGDHITTVEERRADRLKDEASRPWSWQFGAKTEADYPLGYAKE